MSSVEFQLQALTTPRTDIGTGNLPMTNIGYRNMTETLVDLAKDRVGVIAIANGGTGYIAVRHLTTERSQGWHVEYTHAPLMDEDGEMVTTSHAFEYKAEGIGRALRKCVTDAIQYEVEPDTTNPV